MFKENKFLAIIVLFLFMVIMGSCGGGGGGGGSNPPSDTTVSGTVSPPAGVSPSSLTIVSLGETSPVSTTGSFSAEVYKEGVAVIAAMPEGKEFGLMNVVTTSTTSTSSAKVTNGETKIVSAYKATSSSSIELNAKTTAVSMVFITPYFLTNDPVKAADLISIIENDPKVESLSIVIENVFNESDPLSNSTLQQALINAVQSVLDTVSAQASMATKTRASSFPKILQLPKSSLAKSLKALFVANPPYYADQDYITVKAIETTSGYDVSVESKNGGSVDWIAGAMQLDSSQFSSLLDLQVKASNNRSLYENEQSHILGELDATAKSYFRYFDLIGTAFDWAFSEVSGNILKDSVTVPSTEDGIYLLRAYSGGWGKGVDHEGKEEKSFVRTEVQNGSAMDTKSLSVNGFMVIFDTMSAFVAFDRLFPEEMNEVAKAGLEEAFSKVPYVVANPDPNMRDLISVSADITKATLSKLTEILMEELSKNFLRTIYRTTEIIGKSVVNLATFNTEIKLGKPANRAIDLLLTATPMETAIIVVGEPFPAPVDTEKPSTPTNLQATAISSTQIYLSWNSSTDNVGVAGYKIYRNGSHLKSVTTTSTSDTGLNPSTQYCYTVSAYDAAGNESDQSSQVCTTTLSTPDTTPPSVPTNLTATAISSSQIDLSWTASTDNVGVVGYKIYRDGSYLKSVTTTSTSDTGLNPNTQYCYTVSAYDAAGNESDKSSQVCATTLSISINTWTTKAPMSTGRFLLTSSAVAGKIFVIGGQESTGAIVGTVDEYNPLTDSWTQKSPMPTPRAILTASEVNGKNYVFGGDTIPAQITSRSNIVEEYDPATDTWRTRSPMPTARSWAASSAVNGKIYVIGGADNSGNSLNTVEEYDPATNTWATKAPMLTVRAGLTVSAVNGKIYAIGGGANYTDLGTVEEYDPAANTWKPKTSMLTPRSQITSSVINEKIYVIGGGNNTGFLSVNEEYDPSTDTWTTKVPMPTPRQGLTSSAVNGKIYAIGGGNTTGFLNANEEYSP